MRIKVNLLPRDKKVVEVVDPMNPPSIYTLYIIIILDVSSSSVHPKYSPICFYVTLKIIIT